MKVPDIILQQLGGRRFEVTTGSSHFVADGNTLRMHLARNQTCANRLEITYEEGLDLYTMRFYRVTGGKFNMKTMLFSPEKTKEVKRIEEVYCDNLESVFTHVTGLVTRLF